MFAFAIWDKREQVLFLARDRCGKKPLLYMMSEGKFRFASEFQSLLADFDGSRQIHLPALDAYLATSYIPAPLTAYQDIKKLPPAHTLTLKNGEIKL